MNEKIPSPQFGGVRPPATDFQAVRDGRRAPPFIYGPIDLSAARSIAAGTALLVPIAGNVFYSDPYIDIAAGAVQAGIARIHFQDVANQQSPFMTAQPTSLFKVPFTQLLVENFAQPGKSLLIVYGTDLDLQPGLSAQVQATVLNLAQQAVGGLLALVTTDRGYSPGVSFYNGGAQAANVPLNIVAAAANLNGILIHRASFANDTASSTATATLVAKATAPANPGDGFVVLAPDQRTQTAAGTYQNSAKLERSVIVPAGLRLDYISDSIESLGQKHVHYTLL